MMEVYSGYVTSFIVIEELLHVLQVAVSEVQSVPFEEVSTVPLSGLKELFIVKNLLFP
jgi:hypothetical protein